METAGLYATKAHVGLNSRQFREIFFATQWEFAIEKHKRSLDQDDRQTVESFRSWNDVRAHVLKYAPRPISLIHPALEHLNVFANIFAAKLVASLDLAFFLSPSETEEPETLAKVLRMIKQLVYQAEAFNGLCSSDAEMDNSIKEACFDMQVLYLDFLIASIEYIHGAGEARHFIDSALQGGGSPLQLIEHFYT
ncbi:hypothetical protein MAC_05870 [Metarhizium acridum CQMa 102]|uniref:Uncharacterized protein n=1 Tax=Metarhizium acridum (strain CQMa 102) TaxID=655827 RepID=E9E7M2_METAQ|nr:uncharacterized protein MAC_05870 [Metarhizium acridum CQMa 102]EFY88132.1 hypothetical protein MAC_05870 [Metarhizium acridum CQMa 102]